MQYYLLTFNEDYADEHDVPALECFTEEEYLEWLEKPSGKLNPEYEAQRKIYDENLEKYHNYIEELKNRNLYHKNFADYSKEEKEWVNKNNVNYVNKGKKPTKLIYSNIRAYLGNSGDNFEENYKDLYLMKEFVEEGYVTVTNVNQSFYNIFKESRLNDLSLCNIFNLDK